MMSTSNLHSTTVYLVRHGESQLNLAKRISGQLNTPLAPEGHRLSRVLAERFHDVPLTGIHTSALSRTIETARPTAAVHGLPIQSNAALNEQHFGSLEGRFRDERDPEARDAWNARKQEKRFYRVPGGERFVDLAERAREALTDILSREAGGTILIIGHRNTNRVLFGMLMQQPEDQWPHITLRSQCVYRIITGNNPTLTIIGISGKEIGLLSRV